VALPTARLWITWGESVIPAPEGAFVMRIHIVFGALQASDTEIAFLTRRYSKVSKDLDN